jgi:hypothetical protein
MTIYEELCRLTGAVAPDWPELDEEEYYALPENPPRPSGGFFRRRGADGSLLICFQHYFGAAELLHTHLWGTRLEVRN